MRILSKILFFLLLSTAALAQPGPPVSPFGTFGTNIYPMNPQGALTMPQNVLGGGKGAGTINAQGLFINGVPVGTSALPSANLWVGDGTGAAQPRAPSGDLTMSNTGVFSVNNLSHVTNSSLPNSGLANPSVTVNGITCTLGATCTITAASTGINVGTTAVTSGSANAILYNNGGTLGNLTTVANGMLSANGSGVPSFSTTLPNGLNLGTPAAGVGTNLTSLNASALASGTVALARLPGSGVTTINGTSCTIGSSCSPTAVASSVVVGTTTVGSGTSNGLLYNNAGTLGNLATANSSVLVTSGAGVPSLSTTLPALNFTSFNLATTFPGSFGSTPTNVIAINHGSYPATGMIPAGILQQNVASLVIPSTYTQQPWPNVNHAGYLENNGITSGQSGVNFFGTAIATTAQAYAANFNGVVANSSKADPYGGAGAGHDFAQLVGLELNQNIRKIGALTPVGTVDGIRLIGGGDDVRPTGGAFGINFFPLAGFGGGSPTYWNYLLFSQDGAASSPENGSAFASMGATGTGNNVHSQSISGRSRSAGGTDQSGHLRFLATNNWNMSNGLSVSITPTALDTGALLQANDSANALRIPAVLKNDNGGASNSVALGFNTTNSIASETSVSKGGIGWTRTAAQGVGYGSLYARGSTDTNPFTSSNEVFRWSDATINILTPLTYGGVQLNNAVTGTGNMVLSQNPAIFVPAGGSSIARSLQNHFADTVNAADFGADPGNSDNLTQINAAISYLYASGTKSGCVYLNQGKYNVSNTVVLPNGIGLCGSYASSIYNIGTMLNGTGASGQILISVGNGSDNPWNNVVRDIGFSYDNVQSSGAVIRILNSRYTRLENLIMHETNWYDGVVISGAGTDPDFTHYEVMMNNIKMFGGHRGIWVGAPRSGVPASGRNIIMENVSAENMSDAAFYLQNVGGLQGCSGCESAGSARGLVIAPGDNETVDGVLWNGAFLDGSETVGLAIVPTGSGGCVPYTSPSATLCGRVTTLQFTNLRPAFTQNGPGVLIDSSSGGVINGVAFSNLNSSLNYEEGVKILGSNTKHIHFSNSQISYNNVSNNNKSGVYIGSGVSDITLNGGCASTCSTQHPATVNHQKYGVEVASGAANYIIQGMDLRNNITGPYLNVATNIGWSIFNNLGSTQSAIIGELRFNQGSGSSNFGRVFYDGNFHIESLNGSAWIDAPTGSNINIGLATTNDITLAYGGGNVGVGGFGAPVAKLGVLGTMTASGIITSNTALVSPRITNTSMVTSCSGQPTGTFWNNSGVVNVCP